MFISKGGTQQISEHIAAQLGDRVHLCEPVTSISHGSEVITVTTESGKIFQGKKVVLTIPPNQIGV